MGDHRRRGSPYDRGRLIRPFVTAVALASIPESNWAGEATEIEIKPGPAVISPAEAAVAADPGAGVQHGVILIEETERDESHGTGFVLGYHMRAKILSGDGRGLADIEVPVERGPQDVKRWWGRTLLPDGRVLELREAELVPQPMRKSGWNRLVVLKGALPGVVPGAVIDFGYVIQGEGYFPFTVLELERGWPVRSLRYRWVPSPLLAAAYTTSRVDSRSVKLIRDEKSVLVTAADLQPVQDEPLMPPESEVRGSVTFYYGSAERPENFWNLEAKRAESRLKAFTSGNAIREAIETMNIPPAAALHDRLRAAYDWIGSNVGNTQLQMAEVEEGDSGDDDESYNAKSVLKARKGTGRQIDHLFAGVARALGAESALIYAVDRTDHYWNQGLKSMRQFDDVLVGVRAPGEADDKWVVVDAGSGLRYGEIPWYTTGTAALVTGAAGMRAHVLQPSPPAKNRADTRVTLSFSEGNETMIAKWSRTAMGASGMDARRWLRRLDPTDRSEAVDRMCGGLGSAEVSLAELPGLEDRAAPFQIACEIELGETHITDEIGYYRLGVGGPWWPITPELTASTRVHPVVFEYPRLDVVSVDVAAPHGFAAAEPPTPITVESPYGKYKLVVSRTEKGFHIDRAFALTPLIIPPGEYGEIKSFLQKVRDADGTTVTFNRNDAAP